MAQEAKTNFPHSPSCVGSVPQLAAVLQYTAAWGSGLNFSRHIPIPFCDFLNMSANASNVFGAPFSEDLNEVHAMAKSPQSCSLEIHKHRGWTDAKSSDGEVRIPWEIKKKGRNKTILPLVVDFDTWSTCLQVSGSADEEGIHSTYCHTQSPEIRHA